MSNLQGFLDKNRKSITTTSGLDVTVRRLPAFVLMQYGPVPGMETIPPEKNYEMTVRILEKAVITPKIGNGPGELDIYELSMVDVNEIMEAITSFDKREGDNPLASTG